MEEKSAVVLANYVPRIFQEVTHIVRLGAHQLVSWPNNSSTSREEDEEQEEEEEHEERKEQEETGPKPPSSDMELEQGGVEEKPEPNRQ